MILRWFPWRWLVRRLARAHGILDPLEVLGRLENLAQPSEVAAPIELLRAGVALHARGAINARVIQQNLDWVWPFWVNRQFAPQDPAFMPRGFSFAHVNLSHRNWTAVGAPGCQAMPIVDPRGLVTPLFDGWSLDAWVVSQSGEALYPSRQDQSAQALTMRDGRLAVTTNTRGTGVELGSVVTVQADQEQALCCAEYEARLRGPGWLVISLRPLNPEGVGLIERIEVDADDKGWTVDGRTGVRFDHAGERYLCSNYHEGDVSLGLLGRAPTRSCQCSVGMATSAALFPAGEDGVARVRATVDLSGDRSIKKLFPLGETTSWSDALSPCAELRVPDRQFAFLYEAALQNVILMSPEDVYPGPYTYKRFWFRDAVIILHAMLCANLQNRVRAAMDTFAGRQLISGYFRSQSGEWDSNGQVLWLMRRYCELTGQELPEGWRTSVERGARWIRRKRTSIESEEPHAGLLPAGFSAEHFGSNDYYYWDDFWSVAGLREAAKLLAGGSSDGPPNGFAEEAEDLLRAIDRSLERSHTVRPQEGIPTSPYRRMDAAAVGSLACSYPLALWEARDPRVLATVEFLLANCMIGDLFFMDITHSGFNAYLTLWIAQVLLRAGDTRFFPLVRAVAGAASPTGQWPEAIHPGTGGGCMGDGQHAWASAEWIMMMRNMFVREEPGKLILCSGVPWEWVAAGQKMSFGPTLTPYGLFRVNVEFTAGDAEVSWEHDGRDLPQVLEVHLAGKRVTMEDPRAGQVRVALGKEENHR